MDSSPPTDPETDSDHNRDSSGRGPAPVARGRGRPVTVSREARREQILNAAEGLFKQAGYANTSMADIARVCETSKRTLYERFPTKEDLFRSLVADVEPFPATPDEIGADANAHDVLEAALATVAHYVLGERHVSVARLVIAEANLFPEIRQQYYAQGVGRSKHWLESCIAALVACQRLGAVNVNRTAEMLFGAVIGAPLIAAIADRTAPDMAEVAARTREAVARFAASATR